MVKCVNISHPDFKSLVEQSGINSFELELAISDWQSARNTDEFPSIGQLQPLFDIAESKQEPVDQQVKEELMSALNRNGITVTTMKDYEKAYPMRTGKPLAVRGLADTLRNIIAVDNALESNKTLSEEAMHMAVASQVGTYEFNRAMRLVADTQEYQDNYAAYERVYKAQGLEGVELERKIRMEVLGKVGRELLFQNIKESTSGTGLGRYIRRIWNKFLDLFRPAKTELEKILAKWSNQLISGNLGEIQNEGTFFEIEGTPISEAEKLYKKILAGMKSRARVFAQFGTEYEKPAKEFLEKYYDFHNKEFNVGLVEFVKFMSEDVSRTLKKIEEYQKDPSKFSSRKYRDMKLMIQYYDTHRKQLQDYMIDSLHKDGVLNGEQIEEINKVLDKVMEGMDKIKGFHRRAGVKLAKQHVVAIAEDSITDPELREREKKQLSDTVREVDFDANRALFWAGSIVHAKDSWLKAVHYAITKIRRLVDRFTYDLGKTLTAKAKELGIKDTSRFIEKDSSGKSTHYFIDIFRMGAYEKAQMEFHARMHKEYGLPEDKYERGAIKKAWYQAAQAVADGTANNEQHALADTLNDYNKKIAKWFSKNTIAKPNWRELVEEAKRALGGGTTEEFQEWKERNIGIGSPGTQYEYEYPKGELATPSDGSINKRGKFETQTVDWRNPEYSKLTAQEIEFLELLKEAMAQADEKSVRTKNRNKLQLPQVKASTVDLLKDKKFSNIVENIKDIARTAEDDTEFGSAEQIERPDGTIAEFVPVYFVKRLENPDQISSDLISSVLAYADVMENFKQMTKAAPMFEMILDVIGQREVKLKRKQYTGLESEVYKSMKNFLEMNLYGKWKEAWIVGGVNITKLMQGLVKYVTANNLAFSLYTTLASYFTSATYSKIEDLVGQYTTQKDKNFAEKVWDTNIHRMLIEAGKPDKQNKLGLFFEHHRILKRNQDIFNNLDKSRLTRKAMQSGLYWSYELVRLRIRGKLALAIASNYRLYKGKFLTRNELKNLGVEDIDSLPTYYDMVEVRDGRLVATHNDPKIEDIIERKVEYIGANIDGELNYSDWAAAHRGALLQLVTTHRGWLFRNAQLRFKPKGVNYQTGEMDEGWYVTTAEFIRKTFFGAERVTNLKALLARWQTLDAYEKQGVLRTIWEIAFIHACATLALILNNIALDSDEDDDLIQYAAYQSNRVLLELGVMNPSLVIAADPFSDRPDDTNLALRLPLAANIQEMVAILNSPVAATRQLDDLMDLTYLFSNEEIESGPYEGMTKRKRLLIKMIPGVKGAFQFRDPKSRNTFLRNRTLNWLYD